MAATAIHPDETSGIGTSPAWTDRGERCSVLAEYTQVCRLKNP
jgi:hypothetical protein